MVRTIIKAREWLKEIREKKGLSQVDVASESNIERPYYTMIEQGKRNPSVKVAKDIADTLNFNWTIFFNDKCNELKHKANEEEVI